MAMSLKLNTLKLLESYWAVVQVSFVLSVCVYTEKLKDCMYAIINTGICVGAVASGLNC